MHFTLTHTGSRAGQFLTVSAFDRQTRSRLLASAFCDRTMNRTQGAIHGVFADQLVRALIARWPFLVAGFNDPIHRDELSELATVPGLQGALLHDGGLRAAGRLSRVRYPHLFPALFRWSALARHSLYRLPIGCACARHSALTQEL